MREIIAVEQLTAQRFSNLLVAQQAVAQPNLAGAKITSNTREKAVYSVRLGSATRVLIIEDEPLIADVMAEILEDIGFHICAIESTEAGAVSSAARYDPQLMIVDARLREGSGVGAVQTILRDRFVPHVFVSGDRLVDFTLHPLAIFLQKPFLEADLIRAINSAMASNVE